MDEVIGVLDSAEGVIKPEILFYYGASAVLITIFVNWSLATLLVILKPFTCAGILLAFLRPDLVQSFLRDENMKHFIEKVRIAFYGLTKLILYIGEQLRKRLV